MEKKKKYTICIVFGIIYVILGALIYLGIKYFYKPNNEDDNIKMIRSAIEVTNSDGLDHALKNNIGEYALIYGTFTVTDPVYNAFFNDYFSYFKEIKVNVNENKTETVLDENIDYSRKYCVFSQSVNGIDFDAMPIVHYGSLKDFRHKNIVYKYYIKKEKYTGTLLCKIIDNGVEEIEFYEDSSIENLRNMTKLNTTNAEHVFLICWAILLFGAIINLEPDIELDE